MIILITGNINVTEKILNDRFDIRINDDDKNEFIARCAVLKKQPQSLLREMITAINERRLTMIVPDDQLISQQEIYNVDRK